MGVYNLSGLVAHELSGLESLQEVTHATDRSAAGGTEDAIRGGLLWLAGRANKSTGGGSAFSSKNMINKMNSKKMNCDLILYDLLVLSNAVCSGWLSVGNMEQLQAYFKVYFFRIKTGIITY